VTEPIKTFPGTLPLTCALSPEETDV
jgi:hypothetical protein